MDRYRSQSSLVEANDSEMLRSRLDDVQDAIRMRDLKIVDNSKELAKGEGLI